MSKDDIAKISALEHDRENFVQELSIFPDAREYIVSYKVQHPEGAKDPDRITVTEKVVQGKYIVSEFTIIGGVDITIVVRYDKKNKTYLKWIVASNEDKVKEYKGTRFNEFIAWYQVDENQSEGALSMNLEKFGKDQIEWVESYYKDGNLQFSMQGVAQKSK